MSKHHSQHRKSKRQRNALKRALFKRDRGICQICYKDNVFLWKVLRKLPIEVAIEEAAKHGIPQSKLVQAFESKFGGRLWTMDHIIPISKNGPTKLENIRTLCYMCHDRITEEQSNGICESSTPPGI